MIQIKLKEILDKKQITRYELQKITNLNYPRINQLYNNEAKNVGLVELETLTNVLECSISDILVKEEKHHK